MVRHEQSPGTTITTMVFLADDWRAESGPSQDKKKLIPGEEVLEMRRSSKISGGLAEVCPGFEGLGGLVLAMLLSFESSRVGE